MTWRDGVIVTCAPDILFLKDENGDGVADQRRVLLTGFGAANTARLMVTYPTLGLDGRIYVTAGRGQYGLALDPFGRRFICVNRQPVMHVVLELADLRRNPTLSLTSTVEEVSKSQGAAKVFPISGARVGADFMPALMSAPHSGTFTSACGHLLFSGTALGPSHGGNAFICEPAQNLIQRPVMSPNGATFRSEPPYTGKEFLASTDTWFRPVYLAHGPDGALYIADMHRRELDHPKFLPEEVRGSFDFEGGKDAGRIYRVVRNERRDRSPRTATVADLCRLLESAEEWERAAGFQRLMEAADPAAIPVLQRSLATTKSALARVRMLWGLQHLRGLSAEHVRNALHDADAGVREQAAKLAGPMLATTPDLLPLLDAMGADQNARVRFACALSLGSVPDARALGPLATIAARDAEDRWTRAAILTGLAKRLASFVDILLKTPHANPDALAAMMGELGNAFGAAGEPEACGNFLERMLATENGWSWRLAAERGLADGWRPKPEAKRRAQPAPDLLRGILSQSREQAAPALAQFFLRCARVAADPAAPKPVRIDAVAVLGYGDYTSASPMLGALLDPRESPELQLEAIRALERLGDPRGAQILVKKTNWNRYTPQVREAAIASLTSKPVLILVLFDAIESGVVALPQISPQRRKQFAKHLNSDVRARAAAVFKDFESGDRMQVYRARRPLLDRPGDARRGHDAFIRARSVCHTYEKEGGKVGPDLTGIRNQPADALLLHILVPNFEIAAGYQTFTVEMHDGQTISGWLAAETATSLTLRTAAGTEETVPRRQVASINAAGMSLMPDGLEQTLSDTDLGDLIAFLKTGTARVSD